MPAALLTWIKTTEARPTSGGDVLCWKHGEGVYVLDYAQGIFCHESVGRCADPDYWMPLSAIPEPNT